MISGHRRIQADPGHDDAEAVRPDQPHAVLAADGQQVTACRAQAGSHHREGPDPVATALRRHLGHRGRRHRDHRQVQLPGQVVNRRHARRPLHGLGMRIHRIDRPGEAARHDVAQDGPAGGAAASARAHHGDRPRLQQRAQARHIRPAFPARHGLQVTAQPVSIFAAGQGEGQLDRVPGYPPLRRQAGVREHPQHRRVLRQRLRGEGPQAALPCLPDQMLEQQAGDTAAVHVIRDSERHLRDAGLPGRLVGGDAGQPAVLPGQQRHMLGIRLAADPSGFLLGHARAHTEKPQVHVVR